MRGRSILVFAGTLLSHFTSKGNLFSDAFSLDPLKNKDPTASSSSGFSRRQWFKIPIALGGATIYGKLLSGAVKKVARGDLEYPTAHEDRIKDTIRIAAIASIPAVPSKNENDVVTRLERPLRILEVGCGKDCRIIRRNLYDDAFFDLASSGITKIELTGVDILSPSTEAIHSAKDVLSQRVESSKLDISFDYVKGSLMTGLDFDDGFFDCVICSLTLCSVDDQVGALTEIKRVLRQKGGSFGYVEHVAVNGDEPYRLLEFQQELFDGLQQLVADNCHLHRFTEDNIYRIFGVSEGTSTAIARDRFLVDEMWPISCQTSGVIKLL
ncbi:unnamed protein product [Pseudo-nitzschia multistriata]|uniref:Methyltransferase type 11 domain-containing protein n=1 Tax=Pseudo-nitzschia multistriata TaxID=183589 RepID=A0A448Z4I8_9STRA|nr:unnamed protein product [Pseudo-nitzschia multistriata]